MIINALDIMIMPAKNVSRNDFASFQSSRSQIGELFGRLQ